MIAKAFTPLALSAAAAALTLGAGPANADPWGPYDTAAAVTVHAPPRYARQPVTGARVRLDQVSLVVSLDDLDFSTRRGAYLAKMRIERAAKDVCDEVQTRYPYDEETERGCYPTAVRNGLIQAERLSGYPIVAWGYR